VTIETGHFTFTPEFCAAHPGSFPGEQVLLTVSDTGCGMGTGTLTRLYEPFFTTKESGKGTGLGLATVYGIVKQNDGYIDVCSEVGQGSCFQIYFPRHIGKVEPGTGRGTEGNAPLARGSETILLAEDEPGVRTLAARMLEQMGYNVLTAGTPGEAIRIAEVHPDEIHLLLTDVVMPEMNGRNLCRTLAAGRPRLKCLFMSGYTADVIAHHGVLDDGVSFIQKPFTSEQLAARVRDVLDHELALGS
jgi:two-component system, cell cycle sensor histidine kinase and response regulator CckA